MVDGMNDKAIRDCESTVGCYIRFDSDVEGYAVR